MALAVDSTESGGTAHRAITSPLTWSFTNTAGNKLLVAVVVSAAASGTKPTLNAPTYNGVTMTLVGSQLSYDSGFSILAIYYLDSPATGANTVSCSATMGNTNPAIIAGAISFSGAATGVGTTSTNTGSGVTSLSTAAAITTANGNFIVTAGSWGSGTGGSAGGSATRTFLKNGSGSSAGDDLLGEYQQSVGSAITPSFSWTGSDNAAIFGVELIASGGSTVFVPLIGGPGGVAGMPLAGVGGGLVG